MTRRASAGWNAPDGSYGVLYAAREAYGAFAETFLRVPARILIDAGMLRHKAYVRLEITTDLELIRLAGPSLAILGARAEVVHGGLPYDLPQAWSKALFDHPDGIAYYSRHDDEGLCWQEAGRHPKRTRTRLMPTPAG